jgi:CheY-like chemotaxis protein
MVIIWYLARAIIALLEQNPKLTVIAEGSAGNHVLELLEEHQPDVLITDLQMPANAAEPKGALFEPVSTLRKAIERHKATSVIVLSQEHDVQTIQSLAEVGVKGYLRLPPFVIIVDPDNHKRLMSESNTLQVYESLLAYINSLFAVFPGSSTNQVQTYLRWPRLSRQIFGQP